MTLTPDDLRQMIAFHEQQAANGQKLLDAPAPQILNNRSHAEAGLIGFRTKITAQIEHSRKVVQACHELLAYKAIDEIKI